MAGEHQRHQLVADLLVGEAFAVLVASGEQQGQHVASFGIRVGAAVSQLGVDDPVEHLP